MVDPFTSWTRLMSAGFDAVRTGQRIAETMVASNAVIGARGNLAADACRSPLTADVAELGRMVPEKVEAFSRAGVAIATECWAMQTAFLAEAQRLGAIAMRGGPSSAAELAAFQSRGMGHALRTVERSVALAGGAIAPVHAKATSNARRLGRRKKSS